MRQCSHGRKAGGARSVEAFGLKIFKTLWPADMAAVWKLCKKLPSRRQMSCGRGAAVRARTRTHGIHIYFRTTP